MKEFERLYSDVMAVKGGKAKSAKTEKLFNEGDAKIAKKVGEEGVEIAIAAMSGKARKPEIIAESADLIFNLAVLWAQTGVTPQDVEDALKRRREAFGIAEKPGKNRKV